MVRSNPDWNTNDATEMALDKGERAAIALAVNIGAELILMDDRAGVAVAYQQGLAVTGTIGVLDLAARRGLIDLAAAFGRPEGHKFSMPPRNYGYAACGAAGETEIISFLGVGAALTAASPEQNPYHHPRLRQPQPGP